MDEDFKENLLLGSGLMAGIPKIVGFQLLYVLMEATCVASIL